MTEGFQRAIGKPFGGAMGQSPIPESLRVSYLGAKSFMKTNYHTHTARCGHAVGTDEQYIEAAISQGYDELGFSDHVPWPYESGYTHTHVRMTMDRLDEYVAAMREHKKKYADRINLLIGFECEYFPAYMNWLRDMKQEKRLDYLILGNHYDGSDETGMYFGNAKTAAELRRYVEMTVKGIESGVFAYLAHPDLFMRRYGRFDENCRAAARDLCQACKENNLPMEYNLHDRYRLGELNRDGYPHPAFFDIAYDAGVDVIIGIDAHEPEELSDTTQRDRAEKELARFGDKWMKSLSL